MAPATHGLINGAVQNAAGTGYYLSTPGSVINAPVGTITMWGNPSQAQNSGNRLLFGYWSGSANMELFGWIVGTSYLAQLPATKTQRGASWVQTEYNNASNPSAFLTVGAATPN